MFTQDHHSACAHTVGYQQQLTRRFCNTVFSITRQFSSQTASYGRPETGAHIEG